MKTTLPFPRIGPRIPILFIALACLLTPLPSRASVLAVSVLSPGSVVAGAKGASLDVLLSNVSGPAVSAGAFFFELLSSSPDITFTGASTATGSPYIFAGSSIFGPNILTTNTGQDLSASDLGSGTLASAATVGLGHILFNVSPTAPTEVVNLTLGVYPATSLSDPMGANLAIGTLTGARLQINGAPSTVPEPSTVALLLSGLCLAGLRARFSVNKPQ